MIVILEQKVKFAKREMFELQKCALHESIVIVLHFGGPANHGFTVKHDAIYTYIRILQTVQKISYEQKFIKIYQESSSCFSGFL